MGRHPCRRVLPHGNAHRGEKGKNPPALKKNPLESAIGKGEAWDCAGKRPKGKRSGFQFKRFMGERTRSHFGG